MDGDHLKDIDQPPEPSVLKHKYEKYFKVPDVYRFPFNKPGMEKPWERDPSKMDDYFNYGM